jgi:hypothetical protein
MDLGCMLRFVHANNHFSDTLRDWNFTGWQTRHHFSELLALRIAYHPDLGVAL